MIKRCRVDQEILMLKSLGQENIEDKPKKFQDIDEKPIPQLEIWRRASAQVLARTAFIDGVSVVVPILDAQIHLSSKHFGKAGTYTSSSGLGIGAADQGDFT